MDLINEVQHYWGFMIIRLIKLNQQHSINLYSTLIIYLLAHGLVFKECFVLAVAKVTVGR